MKKINFVAILVIVAVALTGCGSTTATPTPATSAQPLPAVVSASGKILPEQWANLSFRAGGPIVELKVLSGDTVKSGDVIARLDDVDAKLAVMQAEAALAVAQAQLAQLKAGPRAEQVAQAEQAVAQAEAAWQGTQAQYGQLKAGAPAADIAAAEAAVAQAVQQQKIMQDAYDLNAKCYSYALPDGTQDSVCPGLGTREEQLRGALHAANEGLTAARARLDQLKQGATKNEIAAATANVNAAKAQREQAKAQLDLLKAGVSREQIAVAEAGVKQAQVAVDTAKAQLAKLQLAAPFDGTIGTVYARQGEAVTPSQPLITIGDLSQLQIETTDLSEADVARVREGQKVQITFDALPGRTLAGTVKRIAPMSTPGQGGVNYTVTVALDESDPALRWGMTAFVDIQVNQ